MGGYTEKDCSRTGHGFPLKDKVVVIKPSALLQEHPEELFLCVGESGEEQNPAGGMVLAVSLTNGETYRFGRGDVAGLLKPELLPDEEKLMLSQIRPDGARLLPGSEPEYSGYSFLKDGRYAAGVWLCSAEEALGYLEMQKPYQYRVLVCDRDDFAVMEAVNGKLIYPDEETLAAFRQGTGGISMR